MSDGKLVLQIRKKHHFMITLPDGRIIKILHLSKRGSTTTVMIKAPKDIKIDRFVEELIDDSRDSD